FRFLTKRRCATLNPVFQDGDLLFRNRSLTGGHVALTNPVDQQARTGVAGNHRLAGVATRNHQVNQTQVQTALEFLHRTMAVETVLPQNRSDLCLEMRRLGSESRAAQEQEYDACHNRTMQTS